MEIIAALKLIDLFLVIFSSVPAVVAKLTAARKDMEVWVEEGRDPTPQEWATMLSRIAALEDAILTD